jgi:ATP-binding cassette, subfamily B, multidrug efflux pump
MSMPRGGGGPISDATDKPQNTKATLMKLMKYIKAQRWLFVLAIVLSISANALQLIGPFLTGQIIDYIKVGDFALTWPKIQQVIILMVVFYAFSAALMYALQILMIYISQRIVVSMRKDLFEKFTSLPVSYFDRHQIGDMLSRMSYDIDTINTSMSSDVVQLFGSVITVIGAFGMMAFISPLLLLVFIITIPASIFTTRYLAKKTRPLFRIRSKKLGDMNGFIEETISGQKTIKAYSQQDKMIEDFKAKNLDASQAYYKADYYGSMTGPAISLINNISMALISLFGSLLYLFKYITLGNISSFLLYSRKFSGPINEAANIVAELQSTLAASERVFRVLESENETEDLVTQLYPKTDTGEVIFEHVNFSYLKGVPVIKDLNLHVKPGSIVAIVGQTGAGKTTMINLLMRFYDVDSGRILIDGVDIHTTKRKDLREQFAMVLQDSWLFYGSIFENISYGHPDATLEDVIRIAKEVNIHYFIERLPQGYDTIITDDGINISKGQKQLITIARAMLQDRKMIILDEATSNVDTRTEMKIQKAMRKLMENKTCFVIAHRLSTIKNADVILVVNDGNIVEKGTHDSLMEEKGYYYQMFMSQFE